jgi:uncharacterized protein (UPF0548 family)
MTDHKVYAAIPRICFAYDCTKEKPMTFPNGSVTVWFGRGRGQDVRLLDEWRDAPVNYTPGRSLDRFWNTDHYNVALGTDSPGNLFQRAALLVMRNRFYPRSVMDFIGDFSLADRVVQKGDRVVQRVRVITLAGIPILEAITLNEITHVIDETDRKGFTYSTTQVHSEIGEWSPCVERHPDGSVRLRIDVISRVRPEISPRGRSFTRRLQLRAHRLSIEHFRRLLSQL